MRPFVIVIPTFHYHELLEGAIRSIRLSTVQPRRIFVIDNGPKPWRCTDPRISIVRPERNVGCAGAWNLGLRLAAPHPVVILNDDLEVGPNTLEKLMATSGPAIVAAHGFSCFRLDQEVASRVGDFDERFYPVYYEDTDYRRRLALLGVSIDEWDVSVRQYVDGRDVVPSTGVVHGKRPERYQGWADEMEHWFRLRLAANERRYSAKWGGPPGAERFDVPFDGDLSADSWDVNAYAMSDAERAH